MNKDEIIRMAREAGIDEPESDWMYWAAMERFAALVAARERDRAQRENAYVAYEREQCALIADSMDSLQDGAIGKAIRARGQA